MPGEPDKASETDQPQRRQFTLRVAFISITLIGCGLGVLRYDGPFSYPELGILALALIGAGIGVPVGWLRKGHTEGALQWACYGAGAVMLTVGSIPVGALLYSLLIAR